MTVDVSTDTGAETVGASGGIEESGIRDVCRSGDVNELIAAVVDADLPGGGGGIIADVGDLKP